MNIVNLPDYRLSMTTELLMFPLQNCHICDKLQFLCHGKAVQSKNLKLCNSNYVMFQFLIVLPIWHFIYLQSQYSLTFGAWLP